MLDIEEKIVINDIYEQLEKIKKVFEEAGLEDIEIV